MKIRRNRDAIENDFEKFIRKYVEFIWEQDTHKYDVDYSQSSLISRTILKICLLKYILFESFLCTKAKQIKALRLIEIIRP